MPDDAPIFTDSQLVCLRALLDTLIPPDDAYPGAVDAGVADYVLRRLQGSSAEAKLYANAFEGLDREAHTLGAASFAGLSSPGRPAVLRALEDRKERPGWHILPSVFVNLAAGTAGTAYYADPGNGGNKDALAWKMVGFEVTDSPAPHPPTKRIAIEGDLPATAFDVVIVGAGAGGGIAAGVLARAGKTVLILERGRELSYEDLGRDHLHNQRFPRRGLSAGPEADDVRVVAPDLNGQGRVVNPPSGAYQANASCVGGGTRVFGAQAWRFMPQDFRMASLYGVPEGSSLADWPITYDDLAPYYEKVEWEIGVAGDSAAMSHLPAYGRPYPMPPLPMNRQGTVLQNGADSLGWPTVRVPLLINSVPYNGRPACVHCQHCVGFGCPVDAKNGSQNTGIAAALATGRCRLETGAMVQRIIVDSAGKATGVAYVDRGGVQHDIAAGAVVVAAGAIESARLLLNSPTSREPSGIGNNADQVGRNLQGHYYAGMTGLFQEDLWDGIGPGPTTATCRFNHGNDGFVGGAMLADDFIMLPVHFWSDSLPPDLPRWGAANKEFMRENYRRVRPVKGPVQEIPHPECRVTLDANVRDRYGIPAVRLSGHTHPETVRTANAMDVRAGEWLRASGAIRVWGGGHSLHLSAGQHQAGTCRMGDDPATSVVDRDCRVHGHRNVYVADGSVHVTNGGFNPVLTIMALAWRTAERILAGW